MPTKDIPGYRAAHSRLTRWRGKASEYECVTCGRPATEYAYDGEDPDELDSPQGVYSLDPGHYVPLCKPCHWQLDRGDCPKTLSELIAL